MKIKLLLLFIVLTACKATIPSNKNASVLFNGENLNGWKTYGIENWFVENNFLTCENGNDEKFGYLGTTQNYKNFELNLEFKQEHKNDNGGVFIHSTLNGTKIQGWQVEIGAPGHFTGGVHAYDRGWLEKPDPIKDKALKIEKWNHLKIVVNNDKMIVWLNGTEMSNLTDPKLITQEGVIALQIHKGDNKLQWRNIKIIEL